MASPSKSQMIWYIKPRLNSIFNRDICAWESLCQVGIDFWGPIAFSATASLIWPTVSSPCLPEPNSTSLINPMLKWKWGGCWSSADPHRKRTAHWQQHGASAINMQLLGRHGLQLFAKLHVVMNKEICNFVLVARQPLQSSAFYTNCVVEGTHSINVAYLTENKKNGICLDFSLVLTFYDIILGSRKSWFLWGLSYFMIRCQSLFIRIYARSYQGLLWAEDIQHSILMEICLVVFV